LSQKTEGFWEPASFNVVVRGTANSIDERVSFLTEGRWEDVVRRLLGFALLASMPEGGLWEALVSLKDIWEFNTENVRHQLPEPTRVRTGTGTIATVSESPDLIIVDQRD
jgi:hypothetical protein